MPANSRKLETITLLLDEKDSAVTLVTRQDGIEQRIKCGRGAWSRGRMAWGSLARPGTMYSWLAAASGAWTADGTFTTKLCFYETPFLVTIKLKFSSKELQCGAEANVGFGPTKEPQLVGTAD